MTQRYVYAAIPVGDLDIFKLHDKLNGWLTDEVDDTMGEAVVYENVNALATDALERGERVNIDRKIRRVECGSAAWGRLSSIEHCESDVSLIFEADDSLSIKFGEGMWSHPLKIVADTFRVEYSVTTVDPDAWHTLASARGLTEQSARQYVIDAQGSTPSVDFRIVKES